MPASRNSFIDSSPQHVWVRYIDRQRFEGPSKPAQMTCHCECFATMSLERLESSIANNQAMVIDRKPSIVTVNGSSVQPNMHGAKPSLHRCWVES